MDILLYLTELLKTRKAIGVAGLGTLYKQKLPGKYNAAKHEFVPPSYTLAFTAEVKEQEELANYISQERNISPDSANYYIGEFAERIQTQLDEKGESDLSPLGQLRLVNDELIFTPTQQNTVGFEFYGLPSVAEIQNDDVVQDNRSSNAEDDILEEIVEENKLEEENPGHESETITEENVLPNDDQEVYDEITEVTDTRTYHHLNDVPPTIETVEEEIVPEPVKEVIVKQEEVYVTEEVELEEETQSGMPFLMKFLIAFLIIVALGAIVYFINPNFFNNYFNKNFGNKQEHVATPILTDTLTNVVDTATTDSLAQNNDLVKLTVDTVAAAIDSSKVMTYEVLVSAVATEKIANKIIANLAVEGVQAKKIKLSKTKISISAGTFLNEYQAEKYRDSLRVVLKNKEIYIKSIKPKK